MGFYMSAPRVTYLSPEKQQEMYQELRVSRSDKEAMSPHWGVIELSKIEKEYNVRVDDYRTIIDPDMHALVTEIQGVRKSNARLNELTERKNLLANTSLPKEIESTKKEVDQVQAAIQSLEDNPSKLPQRVQDLLQEKNEKIMKVRAELQALQEKPNELQAWKEQIKHYDERIADVQRAIEAGKKKAKTLGKDPLVAVARFQSTLENFLKKREEFVRAHPVEKSIARKQLEVAEAEWEKYKVESDPISILQQQLNQRKIQLKKLTEKQDKRETMSPLTKAEESEIVLLEEKSKQRAADERNRIDQFTRDLRPDLKDRPNEGFHFKMEATEEYRRNPEFHRLLNQTTPLSESDQARIQQFRQDIEKRTEKRIQSHEFKYQSVEKGSFSSKPEHKAIVEKIQRGEKIKPEEEEVLKKLELGINQYVESLVRAVDFDATSEVLTRNVGSTFTQAQAEGSQWVGSFNISAAEATPMEYSGIRGENRQEAGQMLSEKGGQKVYHVYEVMRPVQVQKEISRVAIDTWTVQGQDTVTKGGGVQYFSPERDALERISVSLLENFERLNKREEKISNFLKIVESKKDWSEGEQQKETAKLQGQLDIIHKQQGRLKILMQENQVILEHNRKQLIAPNALRKWSSPARQRNIDIPLEVLDHEPKAEELRNKNNTYILSKVDSGWALYHVVNNHSEVLTSSKGSDSPFPATSKELDVLTQQINKEIEASPSGAPPVKHGIRVAIENFLLHEKHDLIQGRKAQMTIHGPKGSGTMNILKTMGVTKAKAHKLTIQTKLSQEQSRFRAVETPSPKSPQSQTSIVPESPTFDRSRSTTPEPTAAPGRRFSR